MQTNIEIDDKLVSQAMQASGARTKKAVVEAGLRLLVKVSFADSNPQTPGRGAMGGRLEWVSFASSAPQRPSWVRRSGLITLEGIQSA